MIPNDDKALTTREASLLIGVSLRTVQLWVEAGVLNAWKTQGGHRRISMSSVNKVVAERDGIFNSKWNARQHKNYASNNSNGLNVLISEDDEVYKDLLEFYFNNLDVPVKLNFVSNCFECLISLGRQLPDIIITNLNMPNINSLEMIRHLASCETYDNVQIIVLTGRAQADIYKKGGLPERVRTFHKPFSFKQLEPIVTELIKHK